MIAADWLSGSVRPDSLRWIQQEFHIQKAFHSIGRIRCNFLETQLAVHLDGSLHGRRMRVQSKPRVTQRSRLLHRPLHKRLADLPSAKRRTHVEPFHLASAGKREGTQSNTADWLSRHRRQKQLALWRAVNAGQRREFRFKRPSAVLRWQLGLVFAKQVTNLFQLLLAHRFHDLAHISTATDCGLAQPIRIPPFTFSTSPVMYPASSDARNLTACATSKSLPPWPRGMFFLMLSFNSADRAAVMAVSMNPGATAFTVMLRDPTSRATAMVKPISPAFDDE